MPGDEPAYYGLRDYGHPGQIGLEEDVVRVRGRWWRCSMACANCWPKMACVMNLGDSERHSRTRHGTRQASSGGGGTNRARPRSRQLPPERWGQQKPKVDWDPVARGLRTQAAGWYPAADIIWHKPNPGCRSVTEPLRKAHEYLFLLSRRRYTGTPRRRRVKPWAVNLHEPDRAVTKRGAQGRRRTPATGAVRPQLQAREAGKARGVIPGNP